MTTQTPQSSNIRTVTYDADSKEMRVTFKSGSTYSYAGVSRADHAAFVGAPSVGSHFAGHIKTKYLGARVS